MQIVIDIPEKIEEYIKDYIPIGAGNNVFCYPDEIVRMIQNGTPIPDNATVCDLEQIRAEIQHLADLELLNMKLVLQIIDKHTKGDKE